MKTLNEDCLYNIFHYAILAPVPSTGRALNFFTIPPLSCSAVSRSWRNVISSHPNLWSYINIAHANPDGGNRFHPSFLRFVRVWLKNSKNALLSIRIRSRGVGYDSVCDAILDLILSEHMRWKEVSVDMWNVSLMNPMTVRCSSSLDALVIRSSIDTRYDTDDIMVDLSRCTKDGDGARLSKIFIDGFTVKWALPTQRESLHLANLSTLRFCTEFFTELDATLAMLSACSNLEILYIEDLWTFLSLSAPRVIRNSNRQNKVEMPRLIGMELSGHSGDAMLNLIKLVTCPVLMEFSFHSAQTIRPRDLKTFATLFSHHPSPPDSVLLRLSFDYPSTSGTIPDDAHPAHEQALQDLLRLLPRLQVANLSGVIASDRLIKELTMDKHFICSESVLCPVLSVMNITNEGNTGLSMGVVEEMLVSRAQSGKALVEVTIDAPAFNRGAEVSERLKALVEDGLTLKF